MKAITLSKLNVSMAVAMTAIMTLVALWFFIHDVIINDEPQLHPLSAKGLNEFLATTDVETLVNRFRCITPKLNSEKRLTKISVTKQNLTTYRISTLVDACPFWGNYTEGVVTPAVNNIKAFNENDILYIEAWVKWVQEHFKDLSYICIDFQNYPEYYYIFTYNNMTCKVGFLYLTDKTTKPYRDSFEEQNRIGNTRRKDAIVKFTDNIFIITERR